MDTPQPVWMPISELRRRAMAAFPHYTSEVIEDALVVAFGLRQIRVRGAGITNVGTVSEVKFIKKEFWNNVRGANIRWDDNEYVYTDNPLDVLKDRVTFETEDDSAPYYYCEVKRVGLEVRSNAFERWVAFAKENPRIAFFAPLGARPGTQTCPVKSKPGRKKGSGSFLALDEPLVAEMRRLVEQGEALSPWEATEKVVQQAVGAGTEESKRRRLLTRYSEKFSELSSE